MPKGGLKRAADVRIVHVKLRSIVIHQAIYKALLAEIEAIIHKNSLLNTITPEGAQQFLLAHPVRCISNPQGQHLCVAGLRSLQVARLIFKDTDIVPIVLLPSLGDASPAELAMTDTYLSSMVFGLDDACWDTTIRQLMDRAVMEGTGLIKRTSKARMARNLGIDKRRLTKEYTPPESELKRSAKSAPGNE